MAKKRSSKKNIEQPLGAFLHVKLAFGFIFKNYKLFLPIILLIAVIYGLMIGASKDTMIVISIVLFLSVWLLALFFARRIMAGEKVKFRDGLFNAMTPFFAALIVMIVLAIQCIPIMILIIANTAAIETNLFGDMFYGSLFVIFAALMIALSSFLLSGSLMALIAVSAPGMYPIRALQLSYELMAGKKIGFLFRLVVMLVVLGLVWLVIVGSAVLINLAFTNWLNTELTLLVPMAIFIAVFFSVIYSAVYLYIYYRKLLSMSFMYEKVDDK